MNVLTFFTKNNVFSKTKNAEESIGIKLSGKALDEENKKYAEIAARTVIEAKESGFFKEEFIPILSEKIKNISKVGCSYLDPFDKTVCLTLEEKKSLNLNIRAKYSKELINGLTEKGILEVGNNRDFVKNMFLRNFHKVSRKYELKRLKEMGIKKVVLLDCNDERDFKAIKQLKKHWNIDEIPELPLPQCTAEYCRCMYIADDSELF